MTKTEYEILNLTNPDFQNITISDLPKGYEGTLVYGYTLERDTFHLYVKDGQFIRLIYTCSDRIIRCNISNFLPVEDCVPTKRVYRQESQFFFLQFIKKLGAVFSITDSNANEEWSLPYGSFLDRARLYEELKS